VQVAVAVEGGSRGRAHVLEAAGSIPAESGVRTGIAGKPGDAEWGLNDIVGLFEKWRSWEEGWQPRIRSQVESRFEEGDVRAERKMDRRSQEVDGVARIRRWERTGTMIHSRGYGRAEQRSVFGHSSIG